MIKPNDLDNFQTLEGVQQIKIDELVREANKSLKRAILEAQLEVFGSKIELATSKTRFDGERYWFVCPSCSFRCGVLYYNQNKLTCRKCLGILYGKQRF